MRSLVAGAVLLALALVWVLALNSPGAARAAGDLSLSTCHLAGPYKHVIYIQYDNTHLSRDNPSVPSDLE
jgi:hypothetical protein